MTTRRKLLTAGLATAAGATGLTLADRYGLVPPDGGGFYGPGETLTYASQRLLTRHSMAREFSRDQISTRPFVNETDAPSEDFKRLQSDGFADWRLTLDGLVDRPASLSISELKRFPVRSQITHLACEEGWSYIAEWIGVPLSQVLEAAGIRPEARYVTYSSMQRGWRDSIDMGDALHPQTLVAYGMNDGELPVGNGGPLRLRVPRQLGYKSVKFINHITVVDRLKPMRPGYAWYAGI